MARYGVRLIQKAAGYRFSLDPLLVSRFAGEGVKGKSVIDLGCGCGIIPLLMTLHYGAGNAVGVDIQPAMAGLAARNVRLNEAEDRISIVEADILALRESFRVSTFDIVVSNPPYRKSGSGRISPKAGRDIARHESTAGLADFLATAKYLVRQGGRICFIHHPSRLAEFMVAADGLKLAPVRLRMVHGSTGAEARMFLAELTKGRKADLRVEPPLFVYGGDGGYTAEAEEILGSGN